MINTESKTTETEPMDPVDVAGESETSSATDHPPSVRLASVAPDETLLERVVTGVRGVYDPEIPLNIYDLGLIYRIDITEEGKVEIDMTLTSPMCPVAESLPGEVEMAARGVDGVSDVVVELVWDPTWGPEVMSEAARLELGIF
jgi:FeS assembly SUF system protein